MNFRHNKWTASPLQLISLLLLLFASCYQMSAPPAAHAAREADAITRLTDGNKRFSNLKPTHPDADLKHLVIASEAQHPFAAIVCCSDSRVPPELIFDQGIGDLFVIRTAGNVIGGVELGSIEYAVEHLGVKLVVVMGHENCGAIKAFVAGGHNRGHIKDIVDSIAHEAEIVAVPNGDVNRVDDCVIANVAHGVKQLRTNSEIIAEFIERKELQVVGARYDLHNYKVDIIN